MNLDLTASFVDVYQPTPFGIFDADPDFQRDADGMVRFVYSKLGGRILGIEMTNKDVYASLEEACLEYSAVVNSYQARSVLPGIIGTATGSIQTTGILPRYNLNQALREADAYSAESLVGGTRKLYSASIVLSAGQQIYDLQGLLSSSGTIQPNERIQLEQLFYFGPTVAPYAYMDSTNPVSFLNNEFQFESYSTDTRFYMLPVWQDILRAQQMELGQRVRRSNYSYEVINNVLKVFPVPTITTRLHFTYYIKNENPYSDPTLSAIGVTTNIANAPFGNMPYNGINALGKGWIRRFALALAKEVLGQVRSKVSDIPIPNGNLSLNGLELINQARDEQNVLRTELKETLDYMTY